MRTNRIISICIVTLFAFSADLYAPSEQEKGEHSYLGIVLDRSEQEKGERSYMGIVLDRTPLPDLLRKHLCLSPDQGIRIMNVNRDAPGDKAGLEKDDIIIGFQGKDVTDANEFTSAVHKAGVGTEVSLEIIHLGKRKTVEVTLGTFNGKVDLKYPPEPQMVNIWRPGRIYKLQPDKGNWVEIPFEDLPGRLEFNITMPFEDGTSEFLKEVYVYHFTEGGETYTITIEGSPNKDDTEITVRVGEAEYETEVGAIDKLPEKYRASVEESLAKARKTSRKRTAELKIDIDEKTNFPFDRSVASSGPDNEMFDRIEKQMRLLQERLEKLEDQNRKALERFSDEPNRQESKEYKKNEK
jgi:hypothetical protein